MASRRVVIRHIDIVSVLRTAVLMALAGLVAWVICVCILYIGLDAFGVWDDLNAIIGGAGGEGTITFQIVLVGATLIGAIAALLTTVTAPILAALYNGFANLLGGVTVTLENKR